MRFLPALVAMCLLLAGCNGESNPSPPSSQTSSNSPSPAPVLNSRPQLHYGDEFDLRITAGNVTQNVTLTFDQQTNALRADALMHSAVLVRTSASWFDFEGRPVLDPIGSEYKPNPSWQHWLALDFPEVLNSLKDGVRPNHSGQEGQVGYHAFPADQHPCHMTAVDPVLFAALPAWYHARANITYMHRGCEIAVTWEGARTQVIHAEPPESSMFKPIDIVAEWNNSAMPDHVSMTYARGVPGEAPAAHYQWSMFLVDFRTGDGALVPFGRAVPPPMQSLPLDGTVEGIPSGLGELLVPPFDTAWPNGLNSTAAVQQFANSLERAPAWATSSRYLTALQAYGFGVVLGVNDDDGGFGNTFAGQWFWASAENPQPFGTNQVPRTSILEFKSSASPAFDPVGRGDFTYDAGSGVAIAKGQPIVRLSSVVGLANSLRGEVPIDYIGWVGAGQYMGPDMNGAWIVSAGCWPGETRPATSIMVDAKTGLLVGAFVQDYAGAGLNACSDGVQAT